MKKRLQQLEAELKKHEPETDRDKPISSACVKQKKGKRFVMTDLSSVTAGRKSVHKASDRASKWKSIGRRSVSSTRTTGKARWRDLDNELLKVGGWGDDDYSLDQFEP